MKGSKRQFPAQTGEYTVKVKNGAGWRAFDHARLPISVGQPYHEGEKFRATLEWAKHRFEKVTVCVNDTLQRHNLEFDGKSPELAVEFAEAAGRQWIENQIPMIRSTLSHYEIIRWDQRRSDPRFDDELARMHAAYEYNSEFKREVDQEVRAFWDRRRTREQLDLDRFQEFKIYSVRFLLEECAAYELMFERDNAVDVYPGSTFLPCKLHSVEGLGKRGFTRIDFSRNRNALPERSYGRPVLVRG